MPDDLDFGQTIPGFTSGKRLLAAQFTLLRKLGQGGMGVVWLARDEKLERKVALKFQPPAASSDAEAVIDLKRETTKALEMSMNGSAFG